MNSTNCEQIRTVLLDYLEKEMPADERDRVAEHLAECQFCKKEYKGLRAMLNNAKNLAIEDPGEEFWQTLPRKVLAQVKQEKLARERLDASQSPPNNIIDFSHKRQSSLASAKSTSLEHHTDFKTHRFTAALALVATLLLVFNVMLFSPKSGFLWFDQTRFQAHIKTQNLTNVAQSVAQTVLHSSASNGKSTRLGFVEQQRTDKGFVVGAWLAESFVYLHDNNIQAASEQLKYLQQYLENQQVSAVTLSTLRKSIEMLHSTNGKATHSAELLSRFQYDYENFLAHTAPRQVALYRAGIWVFNAGLAVAAKDRNAIGQLGDASQIDYLQKAFLQMQAPTGVHNSLREIATISNRVADRQSPLSDNDYRELQQALQNLYILLA